MATANPSGPGPSPSKPRPPALATILKPPTALPTPLPQHPSLFLAGSIDMGTATDWQSRLTTTLLPYSMTILNPRRNDGVYDMVQSPDNAAFVQQVEWELDGMEAADVIAMYFWPEGKAPISLLELGLAVRGRGEGPSSAGKRMVVCCPEGYWRRANVQIVCRRFGVKCVDTLEELEKEIVGLLGFRGEGEALKAPGEGLFVEEGFLVEGSWDD